VTDGLHGAALIRNVVARAHDDRDALSVDGALRLVGAGDVEAVLHPQSGPPADGEGAVIATGLAASPGTATGVAVFDSWRALDAFDDGTAVILVRPETSPADEPAMAIAEGVLTSRGGLTSHTAVVARGRGLPAVCGAATLDIGSHSFATVDGMVVHEGDAITIDGSSGEVRLGVAEVTADDIPIELDELLGWADDRRAGRLGVLANADTAADAERARRFRADGIGLCRTEHQFLAPDRLPLLQQAILAHSPDSGSAALERLAEVQRADFVALLEVMDGLPVTVRLLDPPLHEFLPDVTALEVASARGELDDEGAALLEAARRWREHNPMLGVRGVRLAIVRPALYRMQVRALAAATVDRLEAGGDPRPQVLVPLVSAAAELATVRGWIVEEVAGRVEIAVGAMIETPRAALLAGELAPVADFLSFGTNDLTQMTFGLSRDDVGALVETYLADGLLDADPFATIDAAAVGELIRLAVERARAVRPGLSIGVCGEHGGDPGSIGFFLSAGVDYVSCSPFRVPIARLCAGQAAADHPRI
jgi:pyruvate, orthophosphate dikinase